MCVIIAKPASGFISYETLEKCWFINDDGAGVAWAENGSLHIKKGFMSLPQFMDFWNSREWDGIPMLIHFRISTSGELNKKNTHPFWVINNDLVFAHNGVFTSLGNDKISDTIEFNREVLQRLPDDFIQSPSLMGMIDKYCGYTSKLAFLNSSGEFSFINEKGGKWDVDGCWYSNNNHKFRWSTLADITEPKSLSPWSDEDEDRFRNGYEMYNVSGQTVEKIDPNSVFDVEVMTEILGNDEWYCHTCEYQFSVMEVMDVQVEKDGLVLPKCPCCGHADNVFCWDELTELETAIAEDEEELDGNG